MIYYLKTILLICPCLYTLKVPYWFINPKIKVVNNYMNMDSFLWSIINSGYWVFFCQLMSWCHLQIMDPIQHQWIFKFIYYQPVAARTGFSGWWGDPGLLIQNYIQKPSSQTRKCYDYTDCQKNNVFKCDDNKFRQTFQCVIPPLHFYVTLMNKIFVWIFCSLITSGKSMINFNKW